MSCHLSRRPVSVAALLVLGAGLAFSGILAVWLANEEAERQRKALEHAADMRQTAIQEELDDALAGLTVINRLFSGDGHVDRWQFENLALQLVQLHPYVHGFSFARAGKEGGIVIEQVAPSAVNAAMLGLDIAALPGSEHALERARAAGLPSATAMFNLLPEAGGQRAFSVLMPLHRTETAGPKAPPQEGMVVGYTAIVLRASPFIESIMRRVSLLHGQDIGVSILAGGGTDAELVYRTRDAGSGQDGSGAWISPDWPAAGQTTYTVRHFDAAGMQWQIITEQPLPAAGYGYALLALTGGTLLSALLALCLQSLATRSWDLARANMRLKEDIDARKRIESALRASEERFQHLAGMSSDWYWEQDAEFRFTMVSGETIFGDTPTRDLIGKTCWEMPLEFDERDFAEHREVIKSYQPFTDLEYRVRDANGCMHWMSVSGEPLFGSGGEFLGYRGTGKDITERKLAEQALMQSQTELRELAAHQARVKEDERRRIAREIHDDLGQNLLALRIDVSLLENDTHTRDPAINERIHGLLSQVDNVVYSVRAIVNDLRPTVLDLGLQCAVEWQVRQFRQRSGVSCTLSVEGGEIDGMLDEEAATSIFRIVQESLTNVSRHAYATHVDIRLQRRHDSLVLEISDDGVGSYPGNMCKPRSFGLIGIRERVYTMGGEFRVVTAPGKGTTLTVTIPAAATSTAAA